MEYRFHFSSESLLVSVPSNQGWIVVRNLVVAPLAEEFVFRAAVMFHMKSIFRSCQTLCLVSPLFFSLGEYFLILVSVLYVHMYAYICTNCMFSPKMDHVQCFFLPLLDRFTGFARVT